MATTKTKKTAKTAKTTKTVKAVNNSSSDLFDQSIELSEALIREIDNVMKSKISPAQVGKVLGDIVSGFANQVNSLKDQKS